MSGGWAGRALRSIALAAWFLVFVNTIYLMVNDVIYGDRSLLEMVPLIVPVAIGFLIIAAAVVLPMIREKNDLQQ
ncbi:MAG: hypothetical protein R6V19_12630 [Armatimonadota bacterium]